LEDPLAVDYSEGLLLIGDGTRIHIVPLSGSPALTVGRDGEGPGEFRYIVSVGVDEAQDLIVLDGALDRLSRFTRSGEFLGTSRVTPVPGLVNPTRSGQSLIPWRGGILATWSGFSQVERIAKVGLLWHSLKADTAAVLQTWPDVQLERQMDFVLSPEVFPARPVIGLGKEGQVAAGNGLDYCFHLSAPGGEDVTRVCREWSRAEVGRGIRFPDPSVIEDPSRRDLAQRVIDFQDPGTLLPSFDRLRFGEDGAIWVRTLGPELAEVHPAILSRRPDLGPRQRSWDVFDRTGRLRVTVLLPREFDPRVMMNDHVFGFLEMDTGEIVVGEAVFDIGILEAGNGR